MGSIYVLNRLYQMYSLNEKLNGCSVELFLTGSNGISFGLGNVLFSPRKLELLIILYSLSEFEFRSGIKDGSFNSFNSESLRLSSIELVYITKSWETR